MQNYRMPAGNAHQDRRADLRDRQDRREGRPGGKFAWEDCADWDDQADLREDAGWNDRYGYDKKKPCNYYDRKCSVICPFMVEVRLIPCEDKHCRW